MFTSVHYTHLEGVDNISLSKQELIHNLVNTAKSLLKNGKTSYGRAFHCCFVIEHGKVKEIGYNDYRHKITYLKHYGVVKKYSDKTYEMCKHAEVDAIKKLGDYDFSKTYFLNVHIDRNFSCRESKPCMNCLRMMSLAGVKQCWYFDEAQNKWLSIKPNLK